MGMPTSAAPMPEVGHGSKPKPINSLSSRVSMWGKSMAQSL